MKKPLRLASAGGTIIASAVMISPVAQSLASAPVREFPGVLAEATAIAIAFSTWALLFALAIWVILRVPNSWHLPARGVAILAVASVLLTVGALALVVPFALLNFACVIALTCKASLFAEAVNQAFARQALHSPYPELLLVVPFVVGIAVALRSPLHTSASGGGA